MRVLIIHNRYQNASGEDAAVDAEAAMLESGGHEVIRYFRNNVEIRSASAVQTTALGATAIWSFDSSRAIVDLVRQTRPDIAHCHNLFPLISPSVYSACRERGVPVVQTLHNFRLLCPAATFFRGGRPCESCLHWGTAPAIFHRCYRGSRLATGAVAAMLAWHRVARTWMRDVDLYIALSNFARRKFIAGGLPEQKIVVKPNSASIPPDDSGNRGNFVVYAGRLGPEKGVRTLLKAWKLADMPLTLKIVGSGPQRVALESERNRLSLSNVTFAGQLSHPEAVAAIRKARCLVFPSECYENCPMAILEAFACSVPVIASEIGASAEMVEEGHTGKLFRPGDEKGLARALQWSMTHESAMVSMGRNARAEFQKKYAPERNVQCLTSIYELAIERHSVMTRGEDHQKGALTCVQP